MRGRTTLPPRSWGHAAVFERWYRLGVELARSGEYAQALDPLERALAHARLQPGLGVTPHLRSFYGLALAHAEGDLDRGRRLCEEAVRACPMEAELYVNAARVYLLLPRKDLAVEALETALALEPDCAPAQRLLASLGRRRPPVFSFLPRQHPLNRYAGLLRARLLPSSRQRPGRSS
ncbi:MAG: tetratricopeptide repeat protein [Acidobacteria bacterium]|nr:MAG: tetratricopeptide repeat protein [Acidobacteriota bacterium]